MNKLTAILACAFLLTGCDERTRYNPTAEDVARAQRDRDAETSSSMTGPGNH